MVDDEVRDEGCDDFSFEGVLRDMMFELLIEDVGEVVMEEV